MSSNPAGRANFKTSFGAFFQKKSKQCKLQTVFVNRCYNYGKVALGFNAAVLESNEERSAEPQIVEEQRKLQMVFIKKCYNYGKVAERFNAAVLESNEERSAKPQTVEEQRKLQTVFVNKCYNYGKVAERFNAAVLKTVEGASPPGVRISPFPPIKKSPFTGDFFIGRIRQDSKSREGSSSISERRALRTPVAFRR